VTYPFLTKPVSPSVTTPSRELAQPGFDRDARQVVAPTSWPISNAGSVSALSSTTESLLSGDQPPKSFSHSTHHQVNPSFS